jgi:hypothetical protein
MYNFFGTLLANTRKVLTRFYLSMGTTFIHAMSMAVFMVLKSLDRSHIQLCQQSLARLLQGKNFDNENQSQLEVIMRIKIKDKIK